MNKSIFIKIFLASIALLIVSTVYVSCGNSIETVKDKPVAGIWINTHYSEIDTNKKSPASIAIVLNSTTVYDGLCGIEYHGNSTMRAAKMSYDFELRTKEGIEATHSILNFGPEEDFVLLANYFDKSFARNALAFHLWEELGHYVPKYHYCHLYINAEYQGLYTLVEKIKVDEHRLNLNATTTSKKWNADEPYLLKLDWGYGYIGSSATSITGRYISYDLIYPNKKKIAYFQEDQIRHEMDEMNRSLKNILTQDTGIQHYSKLINTRSFVDLFIVNELSKNPDGFKTSTYLYRDGPYNGSNKITIGPLWDFDLAFNNVSYENYNNPEGWAFTETGNESNAHKTPLWWHALSCDPKFKALCKERLEELNDAFSVDDCHDFLEDYKNDIQKAIVRDEKRWNAKDSLDVAGLRKTELSNLDDLERIKK